MSIFVSFARTREAVRTVDLSALSFRGSLGGDYGRQSRSSSRWEVISFVGGAPASVSGGPNLPLTHQNSCLRRRYSQQMFAAPRRRPAPSPALGATDARSQGSGARTNVSVRLQKALSRAGICSRRAAENLVREGRVMVNGVPVTAQGLSVGGGDVVEVDGKVVDIGSGSVSGGGGGRPEWIALYKPKGVLCTGQDAKGRRTAVDLVRNHRLSVEPGKYAVIGKLEASAAGLVVLTNEKGCAVALDGRNCSHVREYEVIVKGHVPEEVVAKLRRGVTYGSGEASVATLAMEIDVLEQSYDMSGAAGGSRGKPVKITTMNWRVREARQRMIRRMCESVKHDLISVKSIAFGPVRLGSGMKKGSSRVLTPNEVKALKRGLYSAGGDDEGSSNRGGLRGRSARGRPKRA
jgi:23S rRNA pseudouridine2605 synthase